jgi:glycine/D-amino acid oxidase-like deaminating enzyme
VTSAGISSTPDVVVIGGGLIGTAISWRLRQAGLDVVMIVGERSAAASGVAAGMLAPITETTFTEQRLLELNIASLRRYPDFVDELEAASGLPAGLRRTPSLSIAYDGDDAGRLALDCLSKAIGAATTGCCGGLSWKPRNASAYASWPGLFIRPPHRRAG